MTQGNGIANASAGRDESSADAPIKIFINYRRQDSAGEARLLYDRLERRFGADNVFLDVVTLRPGMNWLEEIRSQQRGSGIFLAVIGPRWDKLMSRRAQEFLDDSQDIARLEIEYALTKRSALVVIPVLLGETVLPDPDSLPNSIQPLMARHVERLRLDHLESDVDHLVSTIEDTVSAAAASASAVEAEVDPPTAPGWDDAPSDGAPVGPSDTRRAKEPDSNHYDKILKYMIGQGSVVPLLGSRVNASDRHGAWEDGRGYLPDDAELATMLAQRFDLDAAPLDLAEVAQYVYVTEGKPLLCQSLKQIFGVDSEPSAVHRFLARLPRRLDELHLPKRNQLIVTTNYDNSLENAFYEEGEPFDLAVFMASGPDKGCFVHMPHGGEPVTIRVPNRYEEFPIDEDLELRRTVIVKIQGAVDGRVGDYQWKENYVITEDQYIEYLSKSPPESLIPIQILAKLTGSHCLFFGYTIRDWRLRVFLKRIWTGDSLDAKSWSIEDSTDGIEQEFWGHSGVELFDIPLSEYVDELDRRIAVHSDAAR